MVVFLLSLSLPLFFHILGSSTTFIFLSKKSVNVVKRRWEARGLKIGPWVDFTGDFGQLFPESVLQTTDVPFSLFSVPGGSWAPRQASLQNRASMGFSRGAKPAHATIQGTRWRFCRETTSRRYEASGPPGQLTQIHGHFPQAAHFLLSLWRLYLVRPITLFTTISDGMNSWLFYDFDDLLWKGRF